MNRETWEQSADWAEMLQTSWSEQLPHRPGMRKLRLWVVAGCRHILAMQSADPLFLQYVSFQDRVNDNWETPDPPPLEGWARQLTLAEQFADGGLQDKTKRRLAQEKLGGPWSIFHLPMSRSRMTVAEVIRTFRGFKQHHTGPCDDTLAGFVRDIFGNPFQPVDFNPTWRTEHTVGIAAKMYDERDFATMSILADALEEAGCDSETILTHCREPGVHVRGCWVVDLALGKA